MKPRYRFLALAFALAISAILFAGSAWAQQGNGYLKAKVNPGRAGVFLDGKYLGPAANFRMARKYSVPAGEHELKLVDPRFEEFATKVNIQPGKTTVISEALKALPPPKPPFGRLRVKSADKFAPVYINGKFMGHSGEFNNSTQGLLLPPGDYEVKVVQTSGAEHTEKIKLDANAVVIVNAEKK
jgi:hypothetical protein